MQVATQGKSSTGFDFLSDSEFLLKNPVYTFMSALINLLQQLSSYKKPKRSKITCSYSIQHIHVIAPSFVILLLVLFNISGWLRIIEI